jgi:hypothetical protein
VFDSLRP